MLVRLFLVLGVVITAAGGFVARAEAHRPGCAAVTNPYPVGDARKVYGIPHGCAWVSSPRTRQAQPVVKTRIHGVTRSFALSRMPLGDAAGVCWVSAFVVQWPLFVVSTDGVWVRRGGRDECVSSYDAAPTWIYRFTAGQPRRLVTSPPYRAGG